MTALIPALSPGCFGSALAYEPTTPVCSVCKFAELCRPMHESNLAALRERVGVKVKASRKAQSLVDLKPAAAPTALTVPKKVQALVDRFDSAGLRITENFAKGINPFAGQAGFLKIAGVLLLKLGRPLDRHTLAYAFQSKLGWTEGTADSHARMTMQALTIIGAVDVVDGLVSLRK